MHGVLRVSDLPHSDKIKYLDAEDATVAHVVSIREEVVATPRRRECGGRSAAGTPAEPEVAKKGKGEGAAEARQEAGSRRKEVSLGGSKHADGWQSVRAQGPFWWWGSAIPASSICGRRITRGSWQLTASPNRRALWCRTGAAGRLPQPADRGARSRLAKPETFMNLSGLSVAALVRSSKWTRHGTCS